MDVDPNTAPSVIRPTTAADPAGSAPAPLNVGPGFAWNPAILGGRQPVMTGLGARPRTVPHRALLVRAAVHPVRSAQRPMILVVGGAAVGILGWIVMTAVVVDIATSQSVAQSAQAYQLALAIPAYLLGIAVFSYGWQLGDRQKAIGFGIRLAVIGIVVWLIVALAAVVLVGLAGLAKGSSSSSSGSGSGSGSGSSSGSGSGGGDALGGVVSAAGRTLFGHDSGGPGSGGWSWHHPEAPTGAAGMLSAESGPERGRPAGRDLLDGPPPGPGPR